MHNLIPTLSTHTQQQMHKQCVASCYYNNRADAVVYNTRSNKQSYFFFKRDWYPTSMTSLWINLPMMILCQLNWIQQKWLVIHMKCSKIQNILLFHLHKPSCSYQGQYPISLWIVKVRFESLASFMHAFRQLRLHSTFHWRLVVVYKYDKKYWCWGMPFPYRCSWWTAEQLL